MSVVSRAGEVQHTVVLACGVDGVRNDPVTEARSDTKAQNHGPTQTSSTRSTTLSRSTTEKTRSMPEHVGSPTKGLTGVSVPIDHNFA